MAQLIMRPNTKYTPRMADGIRSFFDPILQRLYGEWGIFGEGAEGRARVRAVGRFLIEHWAARANRTH